MQEGLGTQLDVAREQNDGEKGPKVAGQKWGPGVLRPLAWVEVKQKKHWAGSQN